MSLFILLILHIIIIGDDMKLYKKIENVMLDHFNNQLFHRPIDEILLDAKKVKPKLAYPCKLLQQIQINHLDFIFHHYGLKHKKLILYFPGGAFTDPPTMLHYKFAKRLSRVTKSHVIMIQYPLFPETDPSVTANLLKQIIINKQYKDFAIIGDSAGANLAIYLLQSLHQDNTNIINKTILVSPFIDSSMNNPNIKIIESSDFILNKDNCYKLSKNIYSKYLNNNMYLFPSSEDFVFNSDVLIISGGGEIFTFDALKWTMQQKVLNVKHYVYNKLCHCFTIFPISEAKKAMKDINNFLLENIDNA